MTDITVAYWFRQRWLPSNGIFILTTRRLEPWLDDCKAWFESRPLETLCEFEVETRRFLFGQTQFERNVFSDAYHRHTEICLSIARQMGVPLYQWDVVEHPNWDFLAELSGRKTDQPFPFTPGVYPKVYQAVESIQARLRQEGKDPEFF